MLPRMFKTLLLGLPLFAVAQQAGLSIQGGFEDATVSGNAFNAGGTITVNGFSMNIPQNLLVQFPAAWVPWKDVVANKADLTGFETFVVGNTINGAHQVAQVQMYEFFEGGGSGFIESIDSSAGTLKIANGPVVRINDPNGVFSVGYTGAPLMAVDDVSPSVTSFSGFPMCIPRNQTDPLCPGSNRPTTGPGTFAAPDPLAMAPFLPGDFVSFSGFRRGNEIVAFSVVADNVQITTSGDIAYVRMEIARIGIDNPSPNAEVAESRLIGFVSNTRATVSLYAMDVDACTGAVTNRLLTTTGLKGGGNAQNKFEYRTDIRSGYVREYRAIARINGVEQIRKTKNGLDAGTYVQPVNVWIHGEQNRPGVQPITLDFSKMPFLTRGVGADADGNRWGPLTPFPQAGVTITPPTC